MHTPYNGSKRETTKDGFGNSRTSIRHNFTLCGFASSHLSFIVRLYQHKSLPKREREKISKKAGRRRVVEGAVMSKFNHILQLSSFHALHLHPMNASLISLIKLQYVSHPQTQLIRDKTPRHYAVAKSADFLASLVALI